MTQSISRTSANQKELGAPLRQPLWLAEDGCRLGGTSQLNLLDAPRQLAIAQKAQIALRLVEHANRLTLLRSRAVGGHRPLFE